MKKFFEQLQIPYLISLAEKTQTDEELMALFTVYLTFHPQEFTLKITENPLESGDVYYSVTRELSKEVLNNFYKFAPKILYSTKLTFNYIKGGRAAPLADDSIENPDPYFTNEEKIEYTQYFLNNNTMNHFFRYMEDPDKNFINRLDQIHEMAEYDPFQFIVVSGAVINAYGYRRSTDFDARFRWTGEKKKYPSKLKYFSGKSMYDPDRQKEILYTVTDNVPDFGSNFEDLFDNPKCHFYFKRFKFLSLPIQTSIKSIRITPKGFADVYFYRHKFGVTVPKYQKLPKHGKVLSKVGKYTAIYPNRSTFMQLMQAKLKEFYKLDVELKDLYLEVLNDDMIS